MDSQRPIPTVDVEMNDAGPVVRRQVDIPKSPSVLAVSGSPAEEREALLDPQEAKPPVGNGTPRSTLSSVGSSTSLDSAALSGVETAAPIGASNPAGLAPTAAQIGMLSSAPQTRTASTMAAAGSPAAEREQLLDPQEARTPTLEPTLPALDDPAASARAGSAPATPPRPLSSLPSRFNRPSALPDFPHPSGPPSPALSMQPGPPTPTGTSSQSLVPKDEPPLVAETSSASQGSVRSPRTETASVGPKTSETAVAAVGGVEAEEGEEEEEEYEPRSDAEVQQEEVAAPKSADSMDLDSIIEARIRAMESRSTYRPQPTSTPSFRFEPAPGESFAVPMEQEYPVAGPSSAAPFAVPTVPASRSIPTTTQRGAPSTAGLPQDIAHILSSDFFNSTAANDAAIEAQKRKENEIKRIAEEMKRKALKAETKEEDSDSSDDDTSSEDLSSSDQDSSEEAEEGEADDGSGDEEKEKLENAKVLATVRKEVEAAMREPAGVNSSEAGADGSSSSSSSDFDESTLTGSAPRQPGTRARRNRRRGKGKSKTTAANGDLSGSDDYDSDLDDPRTRGAVSGPLRTEHELPDEGPTDLGLPFEQVPEAETGKLMLLGKIASVIGGVVVVSGDMGMGSTRVLDEGSVVCWQDGKVIGRIFETFGAVTAPHYSIRFPPSTKVPLPSPPFTTGASVFFVPSHSAFVFTQQLKALPKGSDASNIWDEEVRGDEVEFSDDEEEAAYRHAMKMERRRARDDSVASGASFGSSRGGSRGRGRGRGRGGSRPPSEDWRSRAGSETVLSYDDDLQDQDQEYNVLQRPTGGINYDDPPPGFGASSRESSAMRSQSFPEHRGGRGGHGRGRGDRRGRGHDGGGGGRGGHMRRPSGSDQRPIAPLPQSRPAPPSSPLPSSSGFAAASPSAPGPDSRAPATTVHGYHRYDIPTPPQPHPAPISQPLQPPQMLQGFAPPPFIPAYDPTFSQPQAYGQPFAPPQQAFPPFSYAQPGMPMVAQHAPVGGGHFNPRFFPNGPAAGQAPPPWMFGSHGRQQ